MFFHAIRKPELIHACSTRPVRLKTFRVTVDSQKIVRSKFCEFTEKSIFTVFNFAILVATWSASYTLRVAALIIAYFNFASEA